MTVVASALSSDHSSGIGLQRRTDERREFSDAAGGLEKALRGLGMLTGVAYLIVGVAGAIWPGHWDDAAASDQIVWAVLLITGGLLVLTGLRLLRIAPARGATLVSIGAVIGAPPIFWALLPLLLAVALIVLSVLYARRAAQSPRAAV